MGETVTDHRASCRCGGLSAVATGTPTRISVCHCLDCQKRSGSAFSAQVRFLETDVTITGESRMFETVGDSGRWARFHFCPTCGTTVFYRIEYFPDMVAIPLGVFDDPHAFAPTVSVYESRKHDWLAITDDVERY